METRRNDAWKYLCNIAQMTPNDARLVGWRRLPTCIRRRGSRSDRGSAPTAAASGACSRRRTEFRLASPSLARTSMTSSFCLRQSKTFLSFGQSPRARGRRTSSTTATTTKSRVSSSPPSSSPRISRRVEKRRRRSSVAQASGPQSCPHRASASPCLGILAKLAEGVRTPVAPASGPPGHASWARCPRYVGARAAGRQAAPTRPRWPRPRAVLTCCAATRNTPGGGSGCEE